MTKNPGQKNIVLYADDDTDDLELVQEAFSLYANNVEVVTASDGSQVVSYLQDLNEEEPTPCLIILDINMPGVDGTEILAYLRREPDLIPVPVFVVTSDDQPETQAL